MTKHVHVFVASDFAKAKIRTTDSPDWNESQHKRDHGKFSSTGGAKGEAPSKPAAKKTLSNPKPLPGAGNLALQERQKALAATKAAKSAQFEKSRTMMKGKGRTLAGGQQASAPAVPK